MKKTGTSQGKESKSILFTAREDIFSESSVSFTLKHLKHSVHLKHLDSRGRLPPCYGPGEMRDTSFPRSVWDLGWTANPQPTALLKWSS